MGAMTHEEAFLEAIREQPDDEVPRLIYADWLEEHGQPERAEFIRVQLRLALLSEDTSERAALTQREQALLAKQRDAWLKSVPKSLRMQCGFRRGFASELVCTVGQWRRSAERLLRACPLLQALRVAPPHSAMPGQPIRRRNDRIVALASVPYLAQLTTLDLRMNWIGDVGTTVLASSPHLAQLIMLNLQNNEIGDAGATALSSSPHLARLTTLNLSANRIGNAGAIALSSSPHLARLTTLNLSMNQIGNSGASALASSPHLGQFTMLALRSNRIGNAGASAFASSPHLGQQARLDLGGNRYIDHATVDILRTRLGDRVTF